MACWTAACCTGAAATVAVAQSDRGFWTPCVYSSVADCVRLDHLAPEPALTFGILPFRLTPAHRQGLPLHTAQTRPVRNPKDSEPYLYPRCSLHPFPVLT